MANNKNLEKGAPFRYRSGEEAEKAGKLGGIASGESRRRKRDLRKAAQALLDMKVAPTQPKMRAVMQSLGIDADNMDYGTSILAAMLVKASNGSVAAAQFLRDTAGDSPYLALEERRFEFEVQQKTGQLGDGNMADEIVAAYKARQRREEREAAEKEAAAQAKKKPAPKKKAPAKKGDGKA